MTYINQFQDGTVEMLEYITPSVYIIRKDKGQMWYLIINKPL